MRRLSFMRLMLWLWLFLTATPLRLVPIIYAAWPARQSSDALSFNKDYSGRPLPKTINREMTQQEQKQQQGPFEVVDMTMVRHFPQSNRALPLPFMNRRWRILHQRYDKYMKKLQVHQMWVDMQSPAAVWQIGRTSNEDGIFNGPVKRTPIQWPPPKSESNGLESEPRYPYAYVWPKGQEEEAEDQTLRTLKRKQLENGKHVYLPTISAGAMTNLGDFFNELKANVMFAEQSHQLGEAESQLLQGVHPHPLQEAHLNQEMGLGMGLEDQKTSKLLQTIRSYRPSQKIRSLVSRNPDGYRSSQFIDPSYMWVGLGK